MEHQGHQIPESEARDQAVEIQSILYERTSPYLRSSKGFEKNDYESAHYALELTRGISLELINLATEPKERAETLAKLITRFGLSIVLSIWEDVITESYPKSEEYKKFQQYGVEIFQQVDYKFKPHKHQETVDGKLARYRYGSPSEYYMTLFFQIYKTLCGLPYASPRELRCNFEKALEGKKILELAPGVGWSMEILRELGGKPIGVDTAPQNHIDDSTNKLDIRKSPAEKLDSTIPENEEFDLLISNNFFSVDMGKIIPIQKDKILIDSLKKLKSNGIAIHACHNYLIPADYQWLLAEEQRLSVLKGKATQIQIPITSRVVSIDDLSVKPSDLTNLPVCDVQTGSENGYKFLSYKKN